MKIPATLFSCFVGTASLTAPSMAVTYPVSGKWGQSASSAKGPIECHGRRVMSFNSNQRTGGMRAYRNRSRTAILRRPIRIVDEFTNGQISDGHTFYTPRLVDAEHIVVQLPQGTVTLQRSK